MVNYIKQLFNIFKSESLSVISIIIERYRFDSYDITTVLLFIREIKFESMWNKMKNIEPYKDIIKRYEN